MTKKRERSCGAVGSAARRVVHPDDFSERVRTRALVGIEASPLNHQQISAKTGVPLHRLEQLISGVKPWSVTDLVLVAIAAGFTASSVLEGCDAVERAAEPQRVCIDAAELNAYLSHLPDGAEDRRQCEREVTR